MAGLEGRAGADAEGIEELIEAFLALFMDLLPELLGPMRDQLEPLWTESAELFGSQACNRGLAAGEVVEECQVLRETIMRLLYQDPPRSPLGRMGLRDVLRLNRAVDQLVTHASVGHTDALFFALFQGGGVPEQLSDDVRYEVRSQLEALRAGMDEVLGRTGVIRPDPDGTGDLHPEAFRELAHQVSDWMADYLADVGSLPVLPDVEPGFLRELLPARPPEEPEEMERVLQDFREQILPGITHWNHPSFHAWFAITGSAPGILGEMLAATLNVNAMLWRSSPAATELEEHVLDWLRQLLRLPAGFMGTINDTASHSTLYALAAARDRVAPTATEEGLSGLPPLVCYTSAEAHSSVDKAGMTLGFGRRGVRRIPTTHALEMDGDALERAVDEDRAAGRLPVAVVATVGTTSTNAVDPVGRVARFCRDQELWLHVDAAYGGPLAMLPERHDLFDGWEGADSIVVNPHKWLFTPVDCSVLWCRHPEHLRGAFALTPEYLRSGDGIEEAGTNLMDYGVALGRRFRALKLWFVLRAFGARGLRARLREHLALAGAWAARVGEAPEWEMAAPCPMATPVFRYAPPGMSEEEADAANAEILGTVNRSGVAFLSHTRVHGRYALRLSIGNLKTTRVHLERTWDALATAAAASGGAGRTRSPEG